MEGLLLAAIFLHSTFYIVSTILILLLVCSIMFRCCRDFHNNRNHSTEPTISLYSGNFGLEEAVIEGFPKIVYSNKGIDTDTDTDINDECVVCLGVFDENEMLRLLPKCGHMFHVDCIDKWLQSHITCPLCRANLLATDYSPQYIDPF